MSPNVVKYASEHDYGDQVTEWQPVTPESVDKRMRNAGILMAIALVLAAISLVLLPWEDTTRVIIGFTCAAVAVMMFIFGGLGNMISASSARNRQEQRTHLYTHGIVFSDADQVMEAFDFRTTAINVNRMIIRGNTIRHVYTTSFTDGKREFGVSQPAIPYADEVSTKVPEVAARAKAPVLLTRLVNGETLDFDGMRLTPAGFGTGDATTMIPYSSYRSHQVVQGVLRIVFGDPAAAEMSVEYRTVKDAIAILTVIRAVAQNPDFLQKLNGSGNDN